MDKKTAIIIVIALFGFVIFRVYVAFQHLDSSSDAKSTEQFPEELPITYSGVIPCADCPGIDYNLMMYEDRFKEISWYQDRDPEPVVHEGDWRMAGDTLFTDERDDELHKSFLVENQSLRMLSRDGEQIPGDLEENYTLTINPEERSIRANHRERKAEGVDIISSGNEPFWNVQIDLESTTWFRSPGDELRGGAPKVKKENGRSTYRTTVNGQTLTLTLHPTPCRDTMSGFLFTHTADLVFGEETFSGCGIYL